MPLYKVENDNLIITIPLKTFRSNPYDEDYQEEMDNLIGLYEGEYNNGLAYRVDMSYKGKDDQWSDYVFKLNGSREEFEVMCKELKIDWVDESKEND